MAKVRNPRAEKMALVIHPDMAVLTSLQQAFTQGGITAILARDLPTALLAITQHYFDAAVVCSRITEEGDGWPLAGILRLVFPTAFIVTIAPQSDVLTLKAAINNGIDEVLEKTSSIEQIASAVIESMEPATKTPPNQIQ